MTEKKTERKKLQKTSLHIQPVNIPGNDYYIIIIFFFTAAAAAVATAASVYLCIFAGYNWLQFFFSTSIKKTELNYYYYYYYYYCCCNCVFMYSCWL